MRRTEKDTKLEIAGFIIFNFVFIKVGTHEGTSRRDFFQGLVRCRVYTMGQVAGTSHLKGLHAGTCYTLK